MSDLAEKLKAENRRYTYNDYRDWKLEECEHYELHEGKPVKLYEDETRAMSAPSDAHQEVNGEISRQIANFLFGKSCKVRSAPYDVRLFYREDGFDTTVVQPDISVLCDEKKRGPEGCRGAPDFIIEIMSPSTQSNDLVYKLNLYMKAGVREYWVIDIEHKLVEVFIFENGKDGRYTTTMYEYPAVIPVHIFAGNFSINLADVFGGEEK
jgi:Uma2 family endonuclease